jgi:serine/threonine protein phosphatase PrpC
MSRSIGDEVSQTVGVISVPEISTHSIKEQDIFVVWATDGVWEFITDDSAIKLLWKHKENLAEAAAQLAEESTKQWRKEEEVIDDITVVLVQFNPSK